MKDEDTQLRVLMASSTGGSVGTWKNQCTEVLGHGRKRGDAWVAPRGSVQTLQGWGQNLDRSTGSDAFCSLFASWFS